MIDRGVTTSLQQRAGIAGCIARATLNPALQRRAAELYALARDARAHLVDFERRRGREDRSVPCSCGAQRGAPCNGLDVDTVHFERRLLRLVERGRLPEERTP